MYWILLSIAVASAAAAPSSDLATFVRDCDAGGRRLWGQTLCAPVVVVDPATGAFQTTQPPPSAPLPSIRANTGFDWGGRRWIMLLGPLPKDARALNGLLFHEAFHVHQAALGLPANNSLAGHLGTVEGRYLIRLEWNALAAALRSTGAARRTHVAQALAFRARRLAGNEAAAKAEREQMRHEGLASYTGAVLSGDPVGFALSELEGGPRRASLARSFAYVSAPAWGLLLDALRPGWRRALGSGLDLPDMIPIAAARITRPDSYGGGSILAEEALAGAERDARIRAAVEATAEDQGLRLPLGQMQMNFDPNQLLTAPDGSPLYSKITLSDRWGRIEVDGFPLRISPDYKAAFARWPLKAPDKLELAPGWHVEARPGGGAILVPPKP